MKYLSTLFIIILIFASCTKPTDKILKIKDGKWNYVNVVILRENEAIVKQTTDNGTITFSDDIFMMEYTNGGRVRGTWSASGDKVKLTALGTHHVFTILESGKARQKWGYTDSYTESGKLMVEEVALTLTR